MPRARPDMPLSFVSCLSLFYPRWLPCLFKPYPIFKKVPPYLCVFLVVKLETLYHLACKFNAAHSARGDYVFIRDRKLLHIEFIAPVIWDHPFEVGQGIARVMSLL